ncbi:hypothetical protein [Micromonospora sp. RTGN7]|uniref:alpha/beta fold hydrolase n=1 Tax=Micromonospora sp. RTGN7 TaxID=3016526 RepID=UPI0029FF40B2|nr:hypothetical protein [Micromonospora sp. RTGN7]
MGGGVLDPAMWTPLRDGAGGPDLVLTVDFGGARPEAGFVELAARLPADRTVLATRPPDRVVDDPADAARQIDAWRDAVLATGARVSAVIGYCSGAAVAARLAQDLTAHRHRVGLVLVDPAVATHELLLDAYRNSIESLGAVLDQPPDTGDEVSGPGPGRTGMVDLARRLGDSYARVAGQVGRELELDDELVEDLVVRFQRYLSYLVVAAVAELPASLTGQSAALPVLTVLSAVHPEDAVPIVGDRRVRFDISRADLLADAGVGRLVAEFITGRSATPAPGPGRARH